MPANYVLLERIELNASASSVSFQNIPQSGYTDLLIKVSSRQTNASIGLKMTFNGYSAFAGRVLEGSGSSASSYTMTNQLLAGYNNSSAYTANTFGSTEIYIPNYTSTTNKSVSSDSVTETNATTAYMALFADLYTTTSPVTTITFTADNSGNIDTGSTFSLYGLAALGTTPVIAPKASGGNVIDFDGTYWIHTFTSSGTFTPATDLSCDYLVVAGGGGGLGTFSGGGGGAGGYRTTVGTSGGNSSAESALSLSAIPLTVLVGAGGAIGNKGSNSVFATITSLGGGTASNNTPASADSNGGSGGGGVNQAITIGAGGSGTTGQGSNGGTSHYGGVEINNAAGGGGGGASAVGGNASGNSSSSTGGNGGNGLSSSITGSAVTRAGGGGGGAHGTGETANRGLGGSGGGGDGGFGNGSNQGNSVAGTANTGGGGGGGGFSAASAPGGSGIVIIRYLAS